MKNIVLLMLLFGSAFSFSQTSNSESDGLKGNIQVHSDMNLVVTIPFNQESLLRIPRIAAAPEEEVRAKNKLCFGVHAFGGISPTSAFSSKIKNETKYEEFQPSGFFGLSLTNDRGQKHFITTGISYTYIAYKRFEQRLESFNEPWEPQYQRYSVTRSAQVTQLFTIPVYAGINYKRFVLQLGMRISYSFYTKKEVSTDYTLRDLETVYYNYSNNKEGPSEQRIQFGPAIQIGYHISPNLTVNFDGYRNVIFDEINNQFNIGFQYIFRKRKDSK